MPGSPGGAYCADQKKTELDEEEQKARIENIKASTELERARKEAVTGENETDEAIDKLDQILKEVRDNAIKQQTE